MVPEGTYILDVDDGTGCNFKDTIIITEDAIPNATISGGGSICDDGTTTNITFTFNGLLPWDLIYTNGADSITKDNILTSIYTLPTLISGLYDIMLADDINDCVADTFGSKVEVIVNPMPIAVITPSEITIYEGEVINLIVGEYQIYEWYNAEDDLLSVNSELSVTDSGSFYVFVIDENNCNDFSENAIVHTVRRTEIYIPTAFTPNGDDHNELFVISGNYINSYSMKIYNKWGEELFVSNSIYKYWDGTFENNKVQQGTYFYFVEVIGEDGNLFKKTGLIEVLY